MAGSTLVEVKRSIVDHLAGIYVDPDWSVHYGFPGDKLSRRSIWLGATTASVETTALRGVRRKRTEEPTLTVAFWAMEQDATADSDCRQQTADEIVFEALRTLDEWIADEGQLGRPDLVDMAWLVDWEHELGPTERGSAALLTASIRYQARLL